MTNKKMLKNGNNVFEFFFREGDPSTKWQFTRGPPPMYIQKQHTAISSLEIMELIPKIENSSISCLRILSYGRDKIILNQTKIFQIGVVSPEL